jgi:hypothetical protein
MGDEDEDENEDEHRSKTISIEKGRIAATEDAGEAASS